MYLTVVQNAIWKHDCSQMAFQTTGTNTWERCNRDKEDKNNDCKWYLLYFVLYFNLFSGCLRSIVWTIMRSNGFLNNHGKITNVYQSFFLLLFLFSVLELIVIESVLYVRKGSNIRMYNATVSYSNWVCWNFNMHVTYITKLRLDASCTPQTPNEGRAKNIQLFNENHWYLDIYS